MGMSTSCEIRERYLQIYHDAFDEVVKTYESAGVLAGVELKLSPIDKSALSAWSVEWMEKSVKQKHGEWHWDKMVAKRIKRCKKFDLAIWGDGILCGLSLGLVTRGRKTVRMNYLQACPIKHPLEKQIAAIAVAVAIAVGQRVGAEHVAIFNPVNAKVENHYRKLGFEKRRIYSRFLKNVMYMDVPRRD
ncbi:hypothetical protein OSC18_26140 [Serratia nevei]|uniref:hypothetical protein n=1 Tax=Serratia nevei TaxID=2703794 RepID=UPI0028550322|nr:hypothetical protein [Serratia nevei]MDR8492967.1 hypothetical protein [Serratia nevei]